MVVSFKNSELAIIQPLCSVNASNVVDFRDQLTTAILSEEHSTLLLDLHRVESFDSQALLALVSAFRMAQRRKQRFILCSVAPTIRMILELTQLDRAFEIFDNPEVGIALMEQTTLN